MHAITIIPKHCINYSNGNSPMAQLHIENQRMEERLRTLKKVMAVEKNSRRSVMLKNREVHVKLCVVSLVCMRVYMSICFIAVKMVTVATGYQVKVFLYSAIKLMKL